MAAPQTVLTSCQIGDIGHPRTVCGNPGHILKDSRLVQCHVSGYNPSWIPKQHLLDTVPSIWTHLMLLCM